MHPTRFKSSIIYSKVMSPASCLDASVAPVSTLIEGNVLIARPDPQYPGSTIYYTGLLAFGSGVSATIGGSGAAANTFENYLDGDFIVQQNVSRGVSVGLPDDTILTNAYLSNGIRRPGRCNHARSVSVRANGAWDLSSLLNDVREVASRED